MRALAIGLLLGSVLGLGAVSLSGRFLALSASAPPTESAPGNSPPAALPPITLAATKPPPVDALPTDVADGATPNATRRANPGSGAIRAELETLKLTLADERAARARLAERLDQQQAVLQRLTTRLARLTGADRQRTGSVTVDSSALAAAGFAADDAEYLARRWGERNMERLYLRDQALREGWHDTPRYREARRALDDGYRFAEELSEADYDRFLYATGRPNRVALAAVVEGSPAQLAGLAAGDMILSYDGQPVRDGSGLRQAILAGEAEQPVVLEVDRDGQLLQVELPRGPLGVHTESLRVLP